MPGDDQSLLTSCGYTGNAGRFVTLARKLEGQGELRSASTAYDRAYGLAPDDSKIAERRRALLDRLAVVEHGIPFRYVPAGTFLMGSETGDEDETPVHPVTLGNYWLSETPVSWSAFCSLKGWSPPPYGMPVDPRDKGVEENNGMEYFHLRQENKIRLQYCEDATTGAGDWHAHAPWGLQSLFGIPPRDDPRRPWRYDRKPMVSVAWQDVEELCQRITTGPVTYRLPSEAEWEKAARGGLIDCPYPWGRDLPDESRCDFNRFDEFSILPMRRFPPNGYGLYSMSGCVWEWTGGWYDAEYYRENPPVNPEGPSQGVAKVLRGGSWADCAEAVTVSFRMARESRSWRERQWAGHFAPNIGFRLCRVEGLIPSAG